MRDVCKMLRRVQAGVEGAERHELAAQLSKVAATAEDQTLLVLGDECASFVGWLAADEPLVQAYAACILANIAFVEKGQQKVLNARAIPPLMGLLRAAVDKKVALHATAAVQNLTFRNGACCTEVLQLRGDAILKKLANHPSEGVQQFATGALANLQLHHNGGGDEGVMALADKDVKFGKRAPCVGNGCVVAATSREIVAAVAVQAVWRGREGRRRCVEKKRLRDKKKPRYETFSVHAVRSELESKPCPRLMPGVRLTTIGAPAARAPPRAKEPGKLAPLSQLPSLGRNAPLPALGRAPPLAIMR